MDRLSTLKALKTWLRGMYKDVHSTVFITEKWKATQVLISFRMLTYTLAYSHIVMLSSSENNELQLLLVQYERVSCDSNSLDCKTRQVILGFGSQRSNDFWVEDHVWRANKRILGDGDFPFSGCLHGYFQIGKIYLGVHLWYLYTFLSKAIKRFSKKLFLYMQMIG